MPSKRAGSPWDSPRVPNTCKQKSPLLPHHRGGDRSCSWLSRGLCETHGAGHTFLVCPKEPDYVLGCQASERERCPQIAESQRTERSKTDDTQGAKPQAQVWGRTQAAVMGRGGP